MIEVERDSDSMSPLRNLFRRIVDFSDVYFDRGQGTMQRVCVRICVELEDEFTEVTAGQFNEESAPMPPLYKQTAPLGPSAISSSFFKPI